MNRFLHKLEEENGAAAIIEYAFVLPVVFAVVMLLVYMGQIHYQRAVIHSAADRMVMYVNKAASDYMYDEVAPFAFQSAGDVSEIHVEKLTKNVEREPYRYVVGLFVQNINDETKANLEKALAEYINDRDVFFGKDAQVSINVTGILFKTVTVNVTQTMKSPFDLSIIGIHDQTYEYSAVSYVTQPTETIRTTKFIIELLQPYIDKVTDQLDGVVKNLKNALSSVVKLDSFTK